MKKIVTTLFQPFLIILIAAIIRLIPHIPNVTPIAAMALFGGVYLKKKYALLLPIATMIVSDIFLGFSFVTPFVYASFVLIGLLGLWLRSRKAVHTILGVSLVSSLLFFLITNFGVWATGTWYPKTLQGLMTCFAEGIPFFRNTIVGDLVYIGLFFGGYEAVLYVVKRLRINTLH